MNKWFLQYPKKRWLAAHSFEYSAQVRRDAAGQHIMVEVICKLNTSKLMRAWAYTRFLRPVWNHVLRTGAFTRRHWHRCIAGVLSFSHGIAFKVTHLLIPVQTSLGVASIAGTVNVCYGLLDQASELTHDCLKMLFPFFFTVTAQKAHPDFTIPACEIAPDCSKA